MATTVVTTQPMMPTVSSTRYAVERDWHSGLFGCCSNMISCICGTLFCCPCIPGCCCYAMYVTTRLEENCCLPLAIPFGFYIIPLRTKIRTENRIKGSICQDCIVGTICHPCAVCQIHRENIYAKKGRVLT